MTGKIANDTCRCFDQHRSRPSTRPVRFHAERQDTSAPGWQHLLALVEEAAADGREVFRPLAGMSAQQQQHGQHPGVVRQLQAPAAVPATVAGTGAGR